MLRKVKLLDGIHEKIKREIGLKLDFKEIVDPGPDDSFKKIHPQFCFNLTDIVEGSVETSEAVKALKKLYFTDYRKKGMLNPKSKPVPTKSEQELTKLKKYQNRFSRQ